MAGGGGHTAQAPVRAPQPARVLLLAQPRTTPCYERGLMARNPHYARLYVSEIYAGKLGGWAWAVCWTCPRLAD